MTLEVMVDVLGGLPLAGRSSLSSRRGDLASHALLAVGVFNFIP